jgi:hypothetical protein
MLILAMVNIVTVLVGLAGCPRYVNELGFLLCYLFAHSRRRKSCMPRNQWEVEKGVGGIFFLVCLARLFEGPLWFRLAFDS